MPNDIPGAAGHGITLDNRKKLNMTGIEAVESFNDKLVQVRVNANVVLAVKGTNLNVSKFNTDNGTLSIDGDVEELRYADKHKGAGMLKKIFK